MAGSGRPGRQRVNLYSYLYFHVEMEKLQCYRCRGWGHKKSLCPTPRPRPQQKAAKQQGIEFNIYENEIIK